MSGIGNQAILSDEEYSDTIGCLNKLKVPQIKDIVRCLSLPLSGKKQDLIDRVVGYLEQGRRFNDNVRLLAVRTIVLKVRNNDPIPNFTALYDALRTGAYNFVEGIGQYSNYKNQSTSSSSSSQNKSSNESHPYKGHVLYFKESPFYKLKRLVHGGPQIAIPSKAKAVCRYQFILNDEENKLLKLSDEKIRFYLLCGVSNNSTASTSSALLQFPIPIEIHVNGTHIKENVRGIKGKPGTARPANVTAHILPDQQLNKIEMAYAGTTESFLLYLYIVEYVSCEEIIQTIVQQPHIHKNSTIVEIKKEYSNDDGEDDDIIVSTSSISLKCPLTYARMRYPTKSIFCQHIQCFDGLSYLQLQEQVPNWICPVCSNKIEISHLAISDYYCDILENTNDEVENVRINDDGTWEAINETSNSNNNNSNNNNNNNYRSSESSYNENKLTEVKRSPLSRVLSEETRERTPSSQPEAIEIISIDSDTDDDVDMNEPTDPYSPHGIGAQMLTLLDSNRTQPPNLPHSNTVTDHTSVVDDSDVHSLNRHTIRDNNVPNPSKINNDNISLPPINQQTVTNNDEHLAASNRNVPATVLARKSTINEHNNLHSDITNSKSGASNSEFGNERGVRNVPPHGAINNLNRFNSTNNRKNTETEGNILAPINQNNSNSNPRNNELLIIRPAPLPGHHSIGHTSHNRLMPGVQLNNTPSIQDQESMSIQRIHGLLPISNNAPMEDRRIQLVTNINLMSSSSVPKRTSTTESVPLLEKPKGQTTSNQRSTSVPVPLTLKAHEQNVRDKGKNYSDPPTTLLGAKLRPLKLLPMKVNPSQNSSALPNIHQLENLLGIRNHDDRQLYQLSKRTPNQTTNQRASISNIYEAPREHSKHGPSLAADISRTPNSSRPSPLMFYGRDSFSNVYQSHNPTIRESNQQMGSVSLNDYYRINRTDKTQHLSSATSHELDTNEKSPLQSQNLPLYNSKQAPRVEPLNQAYNQKQASNMNGSDNGSNYDPTQSVDKTSVSPPAQPNSLRYSRSAFDLMNKNQSEPVTSDKQQGVVGLLGIVLSEDSMHMNQPSPQPPHSQRSDLTPLKGKIDNMRLGTSSDKKRSLSGSSSGRTWNKKMNPDHNDSIEGKGTNHDTTPSKPVYDTLNNQRLHG